MASELLRPDVVSFLDVMLRNKDKTIRVDEIRIKEGSKAVGVSPSESEVTTTEGVTRVALSRGSESYRFNPAQNTILEADDVLIMLGNTLVIQALERRLAD